MGTPWQHRLQQLQGRPSADLRLRDVNARPACERKCLPDGRGVNLSDSHAQQNSVIKLAPPKGSSSKTPPSFPWTGDRWQSACRSVVSAQGISPLGPELHCVKAWDYQYWSPLVFSEEQEEEEGGGVALPLQL